MITGKGNELGSGKCRKAEAFTHIPTNFKILFKKILLLIIKGNRGEKVRRFGDEIRSEPGKFPLFF